MALWTGFPARTGELKTLKARNSGPTITLKCLARSSDFERKLCTKFILSDQLLAHVDSSTCETETPLLSLPPEILSLIFTTLSHAPSQIAFALSCKILASVAANSPLSLSPTSAQYAGFLPRTVFDVPSLMASLVRWTPTHLRLCNHCLTFRPHSDEYWERVAGCEVSNFWIRKTGWTFAGGSWHKIVHDICPACHGSCTLSDYVDCDGCRALGRLGDVDWSRLGDSWRRRTEEELRAGRYAT